MENYKMTAIDIEAGMEDVYKTTVESVKHSKSWVWKTFAAVAFIVLCGAAVFFFALDFMSRGQRESLTEMTGAAPTGDHHEMLSQIAKNRKAAIHLGFSGHDNDKKSLKWMSGVDQSFSQGGLRLEDNEIVIPSDGLYFVYSQASFDVLCEEDQSELSYSILWSSPASPSTERSHRLLEGVKSVCHPSAEGQKNDVYDAIYLGAVFSLYKGDRLSTETSRPKDIEERSYKTFFGVFKL